MPAAETQRSLRRCFARWGLPSALRVDNGAPWGSSGQDLPTDLALWLIGAGVDVRWNPPRRPQDNGKVERSQGTGKRWADPSACDTAEELQASVDEMDEVQRGEYPAVGGETRQRAYPGLAHSGRAYDEAGEEAAWDHRRALDHLSGYAVRRRVDCNGKVSLYHRPHYVGSAHRSKDVFVMLDPIRVAWVFADADGRELRTQPAEELSARSICGLAVTRRD